MFLFDLQSAHPADKTGHVVWLSLVITKFANNFMLYLLKNCVKSYVFAIELQLVTPLLTMLGIMNKIV